MILRRYENLRQRNKELEKLNTAKDKLFTAIGHDLNSVINSTQPAIQLYRSGAITPEEQELILDGIEEKIYIALETLQSLLNWGKFQLKGITLNQNYFNAAEVKNPSWS